MLTTAAIHEIGHGLGIRHHRETEQETDDSMKGGVFDCAMRYNVQAEYNHPELLKSQARYCHEGEIWKENVASTNDEGNQSSVFHDMPAHNCFGQIDIKSDP